MIFFNILNKHLGQIKKGGIIVIIKKIKMFIILTLKIPFFITLIPCVIIIRLVSPWILIRLGQIGSSRIGHFAKELELYLNDLDASINVPQKKYIDFFFLKNNQVCNRQLEKMWRKKLRIWPTFLLQPFYKLSQFMDIFFSNNNEHRINLTLRDTNNSLEKFKPHLKFTDQEEVDGQNFLRNLGFQKNDKFVCLLVRDAGYLNRHLKSSYDDPSRFTYHNYRDGNIDRYVLAAEELAARGYYVFRMGINVLKKFNSSNPKIIDYANLKIRSDFMDIYLGAKCTFCISTKAGFDDVPEIFRKPIAYVGVVPIARLESHNKDTLIIPKKHISKKTKKKLSISEIFYSNVGASLKSEEYDLNNIELEENQPEEIRDLVIEMDERLKGSWKEDSEDLLLQKNSWEIFEKNIKNLNYYEPYGPLHGKIKARFGAKFLRENKDWIR